MRRKIAVSILLSIVLVVGLAGSALAEVSISGPDTVESGANVSVTVSTTSEGASGAVTTQGLRYVSMSGGGMSDENFVLILSDFGGSSVTYNYVVTASAGETVSFSMSNVTESNSGVDTNVGSRSWSARVEGAPATQTPAPPATQTPAPPATQTPAPPATQTPAPPATETPTPSDTASPQPTMSPTPTGTPTSQPSGQPSSQPTTTATTPPGNPTNPSGGGTTGGGTTGGTTGGTAGTVLYLPKTADSTHMWLFAGLAATVGVIAIVAAKKCALPARRTDD